MNVEIAPLPVLIACLGLLATLGATLALFAASSWRARLPLCVLAALGLAPGALLALWLHPELVDGRFAAFKALHAEIEPGMTRDQVLALVERRYPADGERRPPRCFQDDAEALGFFMDPEGPNGPSCEGILLDLEAGRVTRKRYSRD